MRQTKRRSLEFKFRLGGRRKDRTLVDQSPLQQLRRLELLYSGSRSQSKSRSQRNIAITILFLPSRSLAFRMQLPSTSLRIPSEPHKIKRSISPNNCTRAHYKHSAFVYRLDHDGWYFKRFKKTPWTLCKIPGRTEASQLKGLADPFFCSLTVREKSITRRRS